jgi:hypothetical protein
MPAPRLLENVGRSIDELEDGGKRNGRIGAAGDARQACVRGESGKPRDGRHQLLQARIGQSEAFNS